MSCQNHTNVLLTQRNYSPDPFEQPDKLWWIDFQVMGHPRDHTFKEELIMAPIYVALRAGTTVFQVIEHFARDPYNSIAQRLMFKHVVTVLTVYFSVRHRNQDRSEVNATHVAYRDS